MSNRATHRVQSYDSALPLPMCSNYRPVTRLDRLLTFFGIERSKDELPPDVDVWPTGAAPFIRLDPNWDGQGEPRLEAGNGLFGLLPGFRSEVKYGRSTYNARAETVATLASFRESWRMGWRCIVPAEWIYEPCYESGAVVRHRIEQPGGVPLGIGGIYREWTNPADGRKVYTFAMVTINADHHPVFKRMHKPGEEKRMPLILDPQDYGPWLTCSVSEAATFFRAPRLPLACSPDPAPLRAPSLRRRSGPQPGEEDDTGDLFAS